MLFDTVLFLFRFLPLFFIIYFICQAKLKKAVLLFGGVVFCAFYSIKLLYVPVFVLAISYIFGWLIDKKKGKRKTQKMLLFFGLLLNFSLAFYFCQLTSVISGINIVFGTNLSFGADIIIPLGAAVYSLSSASYLIDVYREKAKCQRNFLNLAAYIFMFPSFIAGPVLSYAAMEKQLSSPVHNNPQLIDKGIERFIFGLAKKLLLADTIGALWRGIAQKNGIGLSSVSTPLAWLVLLSFVFQLYFELSGYSSMAAGLINMMGYDIKENFNLPFCASSVSEFFSRWNSSLTAWLKNYIYTPITKNKNKILLILAVLVTCVLGTLWYGATLGFIMAAVLVCLLVILEKTVFAKFLQKSKILSRLYMLIAMVFIFALFASGAEGISTSVLFAKMFVPQQGVGALYYLMNYLVPLCLCFLFSTALPKFIYSKISKIKALRAIMLLLVLALSIVFMQANASQNVSLISF